MKTLELPKEQLKKLDNIISDFAKTLSENFQELEAWDVSEYVYIKLQEKLN